MTLFSIVFWWAMACVIAFIIGALGYKVIMALAHIAGTILFLFVLLVWLAACGNLPDPEEREYNEAMARENLALCQEAYRTARVQFVHYQHEPGEERAIDVKSDLALNECKRVLGEMWAH